MSKEFIRLRMTREDWHYRCTKHAAYIGSKVDGGRGSPILITSNNIPPQISNLQGLLLQHSLLPKKQLQINFILYGRIWVAGQWRSVEIRYLLSNLCGPFWLIKKYSINWISQVMAFFLKSSRTEAVWLLPGTEAVRKKNRWPQSVWGRLRPFNSSL